MRIQTWRLICAHLRSYTNHHPCRCSQAGHPMLESNAAQNVLKYIMVNEDAFVKGAHNRIYPYSSGSIFNNICTALEVWSTAVEAGPDSGEDASDGEEEGEEEEEEEEDEDWEDDEEQSENGDTGDDDQEDGGETEDEPEEASLPALLPEMTPEDMLRKVSHTLLRICACMHVYNMFVYAHICLYTNSKPDLASLFAYAQICAYTTRSYTCT